jgi:LPXTG-motif cell wall-anchored protein
MNVFERAAKGVRKVNNTIVKAATGQTVVKAFEDITKKVSSLSGGKTEAPKNATQTTSLTGNEFLDNLKKAYGMDTTIPTPAPVVDVPATSNTNWLLWGGIALAGLGLVYFLTRKSAV